MKRILVTGGAGFLGSLLCERLTKDPENHVTALDNLYTGKRRNIEPLLCRPNFVFAEGDVREGVELEVDEIYNAACPASPPAYQRDSVGTTETCVLGVINMLKLALKHNARLLQFSTSEVYGRAERHPQREDYWGNVNPIGLRSCYDEGKRCAESLCFDYRRQYGARVKVIRIFNTYGPHMDPQDGRVISNFLQQALLGKPLTIYGDGTQTRSFCYADDLIEGIVRMMSSREDFTGPVNLGNPGEFTLLELAALVEKVTGRKCGRRFEPLPADDPVQRRPDISLAKKELGWEPVTPLEEGLRRTAAYYRALLNT